MSDQWDLEQIERAGLPPERQLTAHVLWTVRNYLRDAHSGKLDKPLTDWNIADIISIAGHGMAARKPVYAQPKRRKRKGLAP